MPRRAIALGFGILLLAGCTSQGSGQSLMLDSGQSIVLDSGQAAVSSEFRVPQQEIADSVGAVMAGLNQPPGEPPPGLATGATERIVLNRLIQSYARGNGIAVTQTQVEQALEQLAQDNGGQAALNDLALQSGIPLAELEDTVATNLLVTQIGSALNAAGDAAAQVESARVALSEYSAQIDVAVAPRYGTWDDEQLAIVPGSDLTQPAVQGEASQ